MLSHVLRPPTSMDPATARFDNVLRLPRLHDVLGLVGIDFSRSGPANVMLFVALAFCVLGWLGMQSGSDLQKLTAQILVGGVLVRQEVTTVATVGATARGGSAQRQALVKVPVIWRHTPAAGARIYQYRVLVEPMDSTGAALAAPGELWTSAALVAEENKV